MPGKDPAHGARFALRDTSGNSVHLVSFSAGFIKLADLLLGHLSTASTTARAQSEGRGRSQLTFWGPDFMTLTSDVCDPNLRLRRQKSKGTSLSARLLLTF